MTLIAGIFNRKGDALADSVCRELAQSVSRYPGDVVEVEVEGLGTLRNHIVEGPTPVRTDVGAQPTESEEVLSTAKGGDWEFRGIRKPDLSGTH